MFNLERPFFNTIGTGNTYTNTICVPIDDTVRFIITDSYGDGMYGSQWQNCSVDGDYTITDQNNTVLVDMTAQDANFGFGTTHQFCVVDPTILNDAGISSIISPSGMPAATEPVFPPCGTSAIFSVEHNLAILDICSVFLGVIIRGEFP